MGTKNHTDERQKSCWKAQARTTKCAPQTVLTESSLRISLHCTCRGRKKHKADCQVHHSVAGDKQTWRQQRDTADTRHARKCNGHGGIDIGDDKGIPTSSIGIFVWDARPSHSPLNDALAVATVPSGAPGLAARAPVAIPVELAPALPAEAPIPAGTSGDAAAAAAVAVAAPLAPVGAKAVVCGEATKAWDAEGGAEAARAVVGPPSSTFEAIEGPAGGAPTPPNEYGGPSAFTVPPGCGPGEGDAW